MSHWIGLTAALGATIPEVGLANVPSQLNMGVFPKTKVCKTARGVTRLRFRR